MRKPILALSILANVALIGALFWQRSAQRKELFLVMETAMRGDELHLGLHAQSLSALESEDSKERETTIEVLRMLVAAGERNKELHRALRQQNGSGE